MLVGEPPFTGPTAQAIVARVMTETPRSLAAQRQTARRRRSGGASALEKLPADRFQSAADFAPALASPVSAPRVRTRRRRRRRVRGVHRRAHRAVGSRRRARDRVRHQPLQRASVGDRHRTLPVRHRAGSGDATRARRWRALSRDGSRLAYPAWSGGQLMLFTQRIGELTATAIPGTEGAELIRPCPPTDDGSPSRAAAALKMLDRRGHARSRSARASGAAATGGRMDASSSPARTRRGCGR